MKKILVLIIMVLLLSGCGKDKVTCKFTTNSLPYKYNRKLIITFENDKVFSLRSEVTEEHPNEESASNAYIKYQDLFNNYNENNVISEFKKNELKITAIYNIDLRDIQTKKIDFEFDFSQDKALFVNTLRSMGYTCK